MENKTNTMTLSDKRNRLAEDNLCSGNDTEEDKLVRTGFMLALQECNKQDKEFIKELKEQLQDSNWNIEDIWDINKPSAQEMVDNLINKLAGEKLI